MTTGVGFDQKDSFSSFFEAQHSRSLIYPTIRNTLKHPQDIYCHFINTIKDEAFRKIIPQIIIIKTLGYLWTVKTQSNIFIFYLTPTISVALPVRNVCSKLFCGHALFFLIQLHRMPVWTFIDCQLFYLFSNHSQYLKSPEIHLIKLTSWWFPSVLRKNRYCISIYLFFKSVKLDRYFDGVTACS